MAVPVIVSINSDNLYSTGQINVIGENFNSANTLLLIDGLAAVIGSITNTEIKAAIPRLPESKVYDVKVMTSSVYRYSNNEYSNSKFVFISAVTEEDAFLRQDVELPQIGYFKTCVPY